MKNKKAQAAFAIVFIILVVIGIIIAVSGYDRVDASHKGVKIRLGEPKGTMNPGLEWTGMFTQVYQYDLRTRSMTVVMDKTDSAVDKDGQNVYATIEVNYKIKPDSVAQAYENIGTDEQLASTLRIEGRVKEGFKTVTSEYSSLEIFQKREEVKQKSIEQIQERFPQEYFVLENIIISNIDFNEAFKAAIEQKKVAEETAKAKEQEVLVNKYEADKQIETARGQAESAKLQAEAEAYQITVKAEAEAKALELKAQELTPLMVENNAIDAWREGGSQVPQIQMTSGSSNSILPFLDMGQMLTSEVTQND